MATTLATTRATKKAWYKFAMTGIMEQDPNTSDLRKFFKSPPIKAGFFEQLLNYHTKDITKPWSVDENGIKVEVAFTDKQSVKIFQVFYATMCIKQDEMVDPTTLDLDAYNEF